MSKKTYHIVDPETGKFVEEVDIGGLDNFVYQMTATGWDKVLRWTFRIALLLCVVLTIAEPVLRESFPVLYDSTDGIVLLGDLLALREVILAIRRFFRKKTQKEVEKAENLYQIVDPEAEKVVGTLRPEDVEDVKIQVDTTSLADKFELVMSHVFMACFLLAVLSGVALVFVPDDWGWLPMIVFMVFAVLMWFSELIRRYNPYDQKNKEAGKFERAMTHFTFVCFFLAVVFGLALFFIPDGWSSRIVTLAWSFAILSAISASVWRHEKENRENGNGKDK